MNITKKQSKKIPEHVAIIMDGNRRWARKRGLKTISGHRAGYDKMKIMPEWFFEKGVKIVSVYAFSIENWNRSKMEVDYLMQLLSEAFKNDLEKFSEKGYRLLISGRINELPGNLPEICNNAIKKTKSNDKGILNVCINYGGRAEIVDAIKGIIKEGIDIDKISEDMISKKMYNYDLKDPDIIVRTSGEQRLSGFQLWQSNYSEFLFLQKHWPDFEETDAEFILEEYSKRKRRFGGNK